LDPVNSLSQVLAVLRRQMSERAAKLGTSAPIGSSSASNGAAAAEALRDIQKRIQERIRALDPNDERRHNKAVRIFLEGVFRREFGDTMLADPAFYTIIDDVQSAMEADPGVSQTLRRVIEELAEKR
jgi:hypothetical protein